MAKFIKLDAGRLKEEAAVATSAGAADAGKIPQLDSNGVLAATVVNSTTTSAGAGDAAKVVALDSAGRISTTMMPVGIGADTASVQASENLVAGDFVNIWLDGADTRVRKADATAVGKEAVGFVLAAVNSGSPALVYFEGSNNQLTSLAVGSRYYLSAASAGAVTTTPPAASGNVVQYVGIATSATSIAFEGTDGVVLV